MSDYSFYQRHELIQLLMNQKNELNQHMVKVEPTEDAAKKNFGDLKARLENEITAIETALKNTQLVPAAPASTEEAMIKSMQDTATVQNLLEVIRTVPKLVTGDSMERFVAEMDQIYNVEVKDQVTALPQLEGEFVRATKRLLTNVMYAQMDKSGEDTTTWVNLKKYLVANHGSKITMFQHLSRLLNLELKPDEKITDFCAKLEEQTHTAALHIKKMYSKKNNGAEMTTGDVFKLVSAMLASIQVRKNHEDIFKSMIKKMDDHWTASSLGADAQDYVDRLGIDNNVTKTGAEVAFVSKSFKNTKSSDQKKSSAKKPKEDQASAEMKEIQKLSKAIQSLTLTNKSDQTGERSELWNIKKTRFNASRPRKEQICFKFIKGECTGKTCPDGRKHVKQKVACAAVLNDENVQSSHDENQFDSLFQHGPVQN